MSREFWLGVGLIAILIALFLTAKFTEHPLF